MGKLLLNVIAYILVITVNALANIIPLNGQTTGEISNKLNVLFTPAGYVFSIWSLIYLLLGLWILRQFPKNRRNLPVYQETSSLFVLSSLLNSLWIFMWHYEYFGASVIVMILLLLTLMRLYMKAKEADASFFDLLPFSVYLGWISVATIANISYFLTYIDWNGFGLSASFWTILLMIVATVLALYFLFNENDWVYPLVIVWALIGIGVQNKDGDVQVVVFTAYCLSIIIALMTLIYLVKKIKK
ncbi:tryptophan-rich sensory protein [Guptibacillus algicola]|uniref:tryptophan-rich sensory protein n=1 Tax=Guptibacillus algicola TaxID=225844 RepID=UPI001CD6254E|nr:tryptophan-rich sensory protein [Alkalihalobacillus algicola]MCA0989328.1 tryptophan-rich sensory protein [Alkalihalobacillus algicola]